MIAPSSSRPANDADTADSSATEASLEEGIIADASRPATRPAAPPTTERAPPVDSATGHYGPGYGEATRHQGTHDEVASAGVDRSGPGAGDDPSCP